MTGPPNIAPVLSLLPHPVTTLTTTVVTMNIIWILPYWSGRQLGHDPWEYLYKKSHTMGVWPELILKLYHKNCHTVDDPTVTVYQYFPAELTTCNCGLMCLPFVALTWISTYLLIWGCDYLFDKHHVRKVIGAWILPPHLDVVYSNICVCNLTVHTCLSVFLVLFAGACWQTKVCPVCLYAIYCVMMYAACMYYVCTRLKSGNRPHEIELFFQSIKHGVPWVATDGLGLGVVMVPWTWSMADATQLILGTAGR